MPKKRLSRPLLIVFACLLSIAVVPLVHIATGSSAEYDRRVQHIAGMSQGERNRLEHNFDEFHKLPDDDLARIHQLHEEVQSNPDLKETLDKYRDFLKSLNPIDRAQIEIQTTQADKLSAIKRIAAERQERQMMFENAFSRRPEHFFHKKPEFLTR